MHSPPYLLTWLIRGFSCNLAFNEIGRLAWRFELAAAFAPAIPILVFVWMIPESPRWLLKKSRYEAAYKSFCRLRNSEVQAARDLYYAHLQIKEEHQAFAGRRLTTRMKQLFTVPRLRRATVASAVCVCSQQFSGINIMAFYSSTIFAEAGYNIKQTLLCSWGFGMVTFLFAFPAIYTMDSFGRRNMLLTTFPLMAVCLAISGCAFLLDDSNTARLPLIAAFSFLFGAFYGPGIGPIPSIYFSEAFPLSHREIGGAFTICVNNAVGSALSLTFPSLLAKITPTGAFLFYAGLNIFATVLIFFFVPETRVSTRLDHRSYIVTDCFFRCVLLRSLTTSLPYPHEDTCLTSFGPGCRGGSSGMCYGKRRPSARTCTTLMALAERRRRPSLRTRVRSDGYLLDNK